MSDHDVEIYIITEVTGCSRCWEPIHWVTSDNPDDDPMNGHWEHTEEACPHTEYITESEFRGWNGDWFTRRLCQLCGAPLPIPGRTEE